MADKKYYLSEIKETAELLNLRKNSEDTLFKDVNNTSPKFAKEIRDKYDKAATQKEIVNLKAELAEVEKKMENYLKELGF